MTTSLPPGQYELDHFPRFGLTPFANRFPREPDDIEINVGGDLDAFVIDRQALESLPRVEQVSDFHCVTTWSKTNLSWSGFRFADVFEEFVVKRAAGGVDLSFVLLRAQDGYRVGLSLQDLLAADVLLADRLEGQPLSIEHGAPLRVVAPQLYGYKNLKHLDRIEMYCGDRDYRRAAYKFMDHPRARVAFEERGRWFPGWFLRRLYRPLIGSTIRKFDDAMQQRNATKP